MHRKFTSEECEEKAIAFQKELRELLHKHIGTKFHNADPLLLAMMQERTSLFNPYMWD